MADPQQKYSCEYAKSGRSKCKKCKDSIEKDTVRMAILVPSQFFDGLQPNWHHYDCFFQRYHPNGPEEIASFENMRFEDQKRIEQSIANGKGGPLAAAPATKGGGKSKKRKANDANTPPNGATSDFTVEYAKSSRSKCKLCENTIANKEIRIGKTDYESDDALKFGPLLRWFHVPCFVTAREELSYFWDAENLPNFGNLEPKDQKDLSKKIKSIDGGGGGTTKPEKAPKLEVEKEEEKEDPKAKKTAAKEENDLKKQSDTLFKFVENLKTMRRAELLKLFEANNIPAPDDNNKRYEILSDALTFGRPHDCPQCGAFLRFKVSHYICRGSVNEWERCTFQTDTPKRKALVIPEELKEQYNFLKSYKFKSGKKRVFITKLKKNLEARTNMELAALANVKAEGGDLMDTSSRPVASATESKLLAGYNIAILGKLPFEEKITQYGGKVVKSVNQSVAFVVTDKKTFNTSKSKMVKDAEKFSIPVVSGDVFDALDQGVARAMVQSEIALWEKSEDELKEMLKNCNVKSKIESTFKSGAGGSGKSVGKSKVVYKGGAVVDPESNLQDVAHILKEGDSLYTATLNLVDVEKNKNSYYKIQVLEDDRMNGHFWVFKAWGRIGTNRCDSKVDRFYNKQEAVAVFKNLYLDKTGNNWEDRKNFRKHPNLYYPIDVDYGEYESNLDVSVSTSTLPEQVKQLISLIFDVSKMKQTMIEFELDLEKMPLGKLSKAQLLEACSTLKEISALIEAKPPNLAKLTAATNKFYTLVPHSFGNERPDIIRTPEMITKKMQMLESLMDIELAFDIIKNVSSDEDPIDCHYKKLNAHIEPLDPSSEEFKLVATYMKNTHASTHGSYSLEIKNLFKVERSGEDLRFQRFKNDENRMLLWHGSRLTNFVGILSQGLRIAPPEAPVTGYMFGKGVYLSDSVSKSANYCCTTMESNEGLMLLSEVALGKSWELTSSNFVTHLDEPYSSVKGVGSSHPDPKKVHVLPDGVKVPLGKMVKNKSVKNTSLLYNEYIVYNEDQVKIRYLVNVKFNYNTLF